MDQFGNENASDEEKAYARAQMMRCEDLCCMLCLRHFATKCEFDEHVQEHARQENDGKINYMCYIEKHICRKCDVAFEVKSDLIIHYNTVCTDAPFICNHCKENCENEFFLQMHLLFHHNYSEKMVSDVGLTTKIAENPYLGEYSFLRSFRREAFKPLSGEHPVPYDTGTSTSPTDSIFKPKCRKTRSKRECTTYNLLDKLHSCEICNESFSRKCVLDLHVSKHSWIKKSQLESLDNGDTDQKIKLENVSGDAEQYRDNVRSILKPSNVVLGSAAWTKVQPRNGFHNLKTPVSTEYATRRMQTIGISQPKKRPVGRPRKNSKPSDEILKISLWKKVKLSTLLRNFKAVDDPKVEKNMNNRKKTVSRRSKTNKKNSKSVPKQKFSCNWCNKVFKDSYKLKRHTSVHTGVRMHVKSNVPQQEFPCELCKKVFKDNYKRKRHFFIHSGERPYTCTKCDKTFARDDHLKRHLVKVCNKIKKSK